MKKPTKKAAAAAAAQPDAPTAARTSRLSDVVQSEVDTGPDLKSIFDDLVGKHLAKHKGSGPNEIMVQMERKLPKEISQDVGYVNALFDIAMETKTSLAQPGKRADPFYLNLCDAFRSLAVNFVGRFFHL